MSKGEPLVLFLKSWQKVVNESADGKFHFSTYIWITLLITRFRLRSLGPPMSDIKSLASQVSVEASKFKISSNLPVFKEHLLDFFTFYGNQFNSKVHILSSYVGRLVERKQYKESTDALSGNVKKHFKHDQNE